MNDGPTKTAELLVAVVLPRYPRDAAPDPVQRRLEEFEATAARRHVFVA